MPLICIKCKFLDHCRTKEPQAIGLVDMNGDCQSFKSIYGETYPSQNIEGF